MSFAARGNQGSLSLIVKHLSDQPRFYIEYRFSIHIYDPGAFITYQSQGQINDLPCFRARHSRPSLALDREYHRAYFGVGDERADKGGGGAQGDRHAPVTTGEGRMAGRGGMGLGVNRRACVLLCSGEAVMPTTTTEQAR